MQQRSWTIPALVIGGICASIFGIRLHADEGQKSAAARVLAAWPANPFELRIVFDRPIGDEFAKALVGQSISFVDARPGADNRGTLRVAAARLDDAGRTLILTTDHTSRAGVYRLDLPIGPGKPISLAYDLSGVELTWTDDASTTWKGWWPTLDPALVRDTLGSSPEHARGLSLLGRKGKLLLETLVTLPKGPVTLMIAAPVAIDATLNGEPPKVENSVATFRAESTGDPMLLSVSVATGPGPSSLTLKATVKDTQRAWKRLSPAITLALPWTPALTARRGPS